MQTGVKIFGVGNFWEKPPFQKFFFFFCFLFPPGLVKFKKKQKCGFSPQKTPFSQNNVLFFVFLKKPPPFELV